MRGVEKNTVAVALCSLKLDQILREDGIHKGAQSSNASSYLIMLNGLCDTDVMRI